MADKPETQETTPLANPPEPPPKQEPPAPQPDAALTSRIASLEAELATKSGELEKSQTFLAEKEKGFASLAADRDSAVDAYRELVQKSNPLVPADMIGGSTIAEINASLEKASGLVTRIRTGIEKELNAQKVPTGSPGRTEPDTSAMTSKEKINYGLNRARKEKS